MSHRKFEHPRCGSLGFLPKSRTSHSKATVKSFPQDDDKAPCHLTAFMGYKAGMTHILRTVDRPGAKSNKEEVVEGVTIIETPPVMVVGLVGYIETPQGLRVLTTVFTGHLSDSFKRRMYKSWYNSKKKAFQSYSARVSADGDDHIATQLARIKKYCSVVRVVCHTQMQKVKKLGQKKAHVMEIQINGGSISDKVDFGFKLFEQEVPVADVFSDNEMIDTIGITRGRGFEGVITRWGVTKLPRKTHRGLRKVACIGSWHPSRVDFRVARAGQQGSFHRTMINKKIYKVGAAANPENGETNYNATTANDLTQKTITPMGGFAHYGIVNEDFLMIKGSTPGVTKRFVALRKSMHEQKSRAATEVITLSFIDTSSNVGHGKFQTSAEKSAFLGPTKKSQ